jgi:hypothetical protein
LPGRIAILSILVVNTGLGHRSTPIGMYLLLQ